MQTGLEDTATSELAASAIGIATRQKVQDNELKTLARIVAELAKRLKRLEDG
jgi:hypothetical protein